MTNQNTTPVWGIGATILWGLFITVVFYFVQGAVTVGLLVTSMRPHATHAEIVHMAEEAGNNGSYLSYAVVASTIVGCALIALITRIKNPNLRDYLALRVATPKEFLLWSGAVVLFAAVSDTTTHLLGRDVVPQVWRDLYATANPMWMFWVALLIGAPLFEELFYRGFLFRGFDENTLRSWIAIFVITTVWACQHLQYNWYEMSVLWLGGILIGYARLRTKSTLVTMAMHATMNLIATVEILVLH